MLILIRFKKLLKGKRGDAALVAGVRLAIIVKGVWGKCDLAFKVKEDHVGCKGEMTRESGCYKFPSLDNGYVSILLIRWQDFKQTTDSFLLVIMTTGFVGR